MAKPKLKPQIFISHISDEDVIAACLKKHLAAHFPSSVAIYVSSDGVSVEAGRDWLVTLTKALEHAVIEIVLCSEESVSRPWVNFEAGAGWIRRIPLIPVCHSGMTPPSLPLPLRVLYGVVGGTPDGLAGLYQAIAKTLGLATPKADFAAIAAEIRDLEVKLRLKKAGAVRIEKPRVLCLVSKQYGEPGYEAERDEKLLESIFPGRVQIERDVTPESVSVLLSQHHFDIVHLVLGVHPDTGDLVFSHVEPETFLPTDGNLRAMSAEAFSDLVVQSGVRLVNLATCHALFLATEVSRVSNMVATNALLSPAEAERWNSVFYGYLDKGISVHRAGDLMRKQSATRLRLIKHQQDVQFVVSGGG
jgi:hypothetical protein